MDSAIRNDGPLSVEIRSTLADGLAVPTVGYNAYFTAKPLIDRMVSIFSLEVTILVSLTLSLAKELVKSNLTMF